MRNYNLLGGVLLCLAILGMGVYMWSRPSSTEAMMEVFPDSVYLYSTADACQSSASIGPTMKGGRGKLVGVVAILEPHQRLRVVGEDLGKEFRCVQIVGDGYSGWILSETGLRRL